MLRILSDLHVYDARTDVQDLRQLEPLLAGVRTLVLNGDSCEMRHGITPAQVSALRDFFKARVPEVVFVTGNHDPDISDTHEYVGVGGRVWVVHGDICLEGLTPWSRHAAEIRRSLAAALAAEPDGDYARVEVRLRLARHVARTEQNLPDLHTRGWWSHLRWVARTFFPPTQVVAMLRSWRDLPVAAAELARRERPAAQVVVTGHVHFPGIWHPAGGPVVINTGSFFRPLGGNLVDVDGDRLRVRRIVRRQGCFHAGRVLAELALR